MNPVIELRLRDHLSLAQAARNLEVSRQTAYAWQKNEAIPSRAHRAILMEQTGWSANQLMVWMWSVGLSFIGIDYATLILQPTG
jgi:hypothetical protein